MKNGSIDIDTPSKFGRVGLVGSSHGMNGGSEFQSPSLWLSRRKDEADKDSSLDGRAFHQNNMRNGVSQSVHYHQEMPRPRVFAAHSPQLVPIFETIPDADDKESSFAPPPKSVRSAPTASPSFSRGSPLDASVESAAPSAGPSHRKPHQTFPAPPLASSATESRRIASSGGAAPLSSPRDGGAGMPGLRPNLLAPRWPAPPSPAPLNAERTEARRGGVGGAHAQPASPRRRRR